MLQHPTVAPCPEADVMTQGKQTPREHSSEPAEGPQQSDIRKPTPGEQGKKAEVEAEVRRHADTAAEGE
ncbi:hypothetical protein ACWEV3_28095 [Saccharopolyspora sp. NPDC003752]